MDHIQRLTIAVCGGIVLTPILLLGCGVTGSPAASAPAASAPAASTPGGHQGIGNGPGYPIGGPPAVITSVGTCTLTEQGDASVGDRYYTATATLSVSAPGEVTIDSADIVVTGPGGSEIGSLTVQPAGSTPTTSEPLVVTSGTVPFTGVADQNALSGRFGRDCKVVSVAYDDGNTGP